MKYIKYSVCVYVYSIIILYMILYYLYHITTCLKTHVLHGRVQLDTAGFVQILLNMEKVNLPLLPINFCGIELLRLATLFAILSSTKALSDAARFMSSLCSFWLFSSFTIKCKTEKSYIRSIYRHLSF